MKKFIIIGSTITVVVFSVLYTLYSMSEKPETDLIFSHKNHVVDQGAQCETCHAGAAGSVVGTDDLLPKEETCYQCHDKAEKKCGQCHSSDTHTLIARIDDYSPKFNHKKHIDKGEKCVSCHAGIAESETVGEKHLPTMNRCMECHETPESITGCYQCHKEGEELLPKDHNELWKQNHGSFSESGARNCKMCHTESSCTECHLGENLFAESHRPDFILTHPISYQMRESDCITCHNGYEYCIDCHTKVNYIKPVTHNLPNWIAVHQQEAKTNYDLCVVCHSQDDPTCMRCHTK